MTRAEEVQLIAEAILSARDEDDELLSWAPNFHSRKRIAELMAESVVDALLLEKKDA